MTDGVYVMRHLDCDENTRDRFRFKVLNRCRIMISPSIARAVCGGREGGGIELDHFSYSQVQIIYCNESLLILYDPTKRNFSLNSEISGASMSCC